MSLHVHSNSLGCPTLVVIGNRCMSLVDLWA